MNPDVKMANTKLCRKIYDQINNTIFNGKIKEDYSIVIDTTAGGSKSNMISSKDGMPTLRLAEFLFNTKEINKVFLELVEFASIRYVTTNNIYIGQSNPRIYKSKHFKDAIQKHGIVMTSKPRVGGFKIIGVKKCFEHIWDDNKVNFVFDSETALVPKENKGNIAIITIPKMTSKMVSKEPTTLTFLKSFKYVCPKCNHVLATNNQSKLICGDCFIRMTEEEVNYG